MRGQDFDGWYAEGAWVLSGEARGWSTASGAFTNPRPQADFTADGVGWGAWEVAARYSSLDLNDHAGTVGMATPVGGIRGGAQRIWQPGAQLVSQSGAEIHAAATEYRRSAASAPTPCRTPSVADADLGQNFDTVALRSQIAF